MQFIPATAFDACVEIKDIDLSYNLMKEVADGTFAGLKLLTVLKIHNNDLSFFDPG